MLSGVASALEIRDQPLNLDLSLQPTTRFAPALCDVVRHSNGTFGLSATRKSRTNLEHICRGLAAPNCRLQRLSLSLDFATQRDRDVTAVFDAARSCQHLQSLTLMNNPGGALTYMDDDTCQALSDLLRSSAVLTSLQLSSFALSLEEFGLVVSGLAACPTILEVYFPGGILQPGSLELLRPHLDDVAKVTAIISFRYIYNPIGMYVNGFFAPLLLVSRHVSSLRGRRSVRFPFQRVSSSKHCWSGRVRLHTQACGSRVIPFAARTTLCRLPRPDPRSRGRLTPSTD